MKKAIPMIVAFFALASVVSRPPQMVHNTSAQEAITVESKTRLENSADTELSKISVGTLNRFHLALVARVLAVMPNELQLVVQYGGIVASDNGRNKLRLRGSIGAPLEWSVFGGEGIGVFWLTISSQRNDRTVCACRVGKERVFVEIIGIDGVETVDAKSLDQPMNALGRRTVRDVIRLLESEPGELERK